MGDNGVEPPLKKKDEIYLHPHLPTPVYVYGSLPT